MDREEKAPAARDEKINTLLRLWNLLKTMRDSADLSYATIIPLPTLHRQMLLVLHSGWGESFPAMCAMIGKDKAQISRALRHLEERGMISRVRPRGPLTLTPEGRPIAQQLYAKACARNRRVLTGLDATDIAELHAVTERLLERANLLYEEERALAGDGAPPRDPREEYERKGADLLDPASEALIVPRLTTLLAYAQRSLALAAKRLIGMPAFDSLVLSFVVANPPLAQASLVAALSRDQSQAARTIRRLIADGLLARAAESTRRSVLLVPTEKGRALNAVMMDEVARREAYFGGAVSPERLASFRQTLGLLLENATALHAETVRGESGPA